MTTCCSSGSLQSIALNTGFASINTHLCPGNRHVSGSCPTRKVTSLPASLSNSLVSATGRLKKKRKWGGEFKSVGLITNIGLVWREWLDCDLKYLLMSGWWGEAALSLGHMVLLPSGQSAFTSSTSCKHFQPISFESDRVTCFISTFKGKVTFLGLCACLPVCYYPQNGMAGSSSYTFQSRVLFEASVTWQWRFFNFFTFRISRNLSSISPFLNSFHTNRYTTSILNLFI